MDIRQLKEYGEQFRYTLFKMPDAGRFIQKHRLWEGFWKYGWLSRILIFIALIFALKFVSIFINWLQGLEADSPAEAISSMGMLAGRFFTEGFGFIFSGGIKYAVLILLEVFVFHFSRRTLAILGNREPDASFKEFLKAQVRMIKVGAFSWVMELLFTIGFGIFFGIFGFIEFLQPAFIFGIQCFFLGFAIVDNYNEQFDLNIRESFRYTRGYIGVAAGAGFVAYLLLLVPLAGTIAAPIITSVAATLVMHELSDLHILGRGVLEKMEETV